METSQTKPAVVLLSGGLDSATTLAIAKHQGYGCHAISFDYGQKQRVELTAAANVAQHLGVASHRTVTVDLGAFGGSALTDEALAVPKDRSDDDIAHGIPITYVPARNTVFLSYGLGLAEVLHCHDIFIGVNAVDYSGYPDCRPAFIEAFTRLANVATKAGVEGETLTVHAPLMQLTKPEIIQRGLKLGVDYSLTHTCYDPTTDGKPCEHCDACHLRIEAFKSLGMTDPALEP
ncbi:MAG: 7-cyano-7-deazaguanine synthase QueC [Phycisphaerales bacterium JB063]